LFTFPKLKAIEHEPGCKPRSWISQQNITDFLKFFPQDLFFSGFSSPFSRLYFQAIQHLSGQLLPVNNTQVSEGQHP